MRPLAVLLLIMASFSFAKGNPLVYDKFWVQFSDKNNNAFSLSRPLEFLSQRALDRRSKQHISLDVTDLPLTESYVQGVVNTGAILYTRSKWLNAITIETTDTNILAHIRALPYVTSVSTVHAMYIQSIDEMLKKESIVSQTDDDFFYGGSWNQVSQVNGNYLHDMGYWGDGIQIAVLDAGFNNADTLPAFDSLRQYGRILHTWDFVHGVSNVYTSDDHGREVLSILAANMPGTYVGAAPHALYYLYITEDVTSEYKVEEGNWIAAAEQADSLGVDIITTSLGYTEFDDASMNYTYADMNGHTARCTKGANAAANKGILVVASAGNSGNDGWHYIGTPADGDSVMAVGAVTAIGQLAGFSSRGPAYGGAIKPNISGQGYQSAIIDANNLVQHGSGTSFSCPLIAGFTACLWQTARDRNNMDIVRAIEQTGSNNLNPNDDIGFGIANFELAYNALLNGKFGQGVFDVGKYPLAFPNPFSENLSMMLYSGDGGDNQVEVFDYKGTRVFNETFTLGTNSYFHVDLSPLNNQGPGVYLVRVSNSIQSRVTRVVKI